MDPNATLATIRELVAVSGEVDSDEFDQLAYHIDALDDWLLCGGFLPDAWKTSK